MRHFRGTLEVEPIYRAKRHLADAECGHLLGVDSPRILPANVNRVT